MKFAYKLNSTFWLNGFVRFLVVFVYAVWGVGTSGWVINRMMTRGALRIVTGATAGASEGTITGVVGYAMRPGPHTVDGFIKAGASSAFTGAASGGITASKSPWLKLKGETDTFKFGLYRGRYAREDLIRYRAGDSTSKYWTGRFWSTDRPISVTQVRDEKAIPIRWQGSDSVNVLDTGYEAKVPKGIAIYEGRVAVQMGADYDYYPGGSNQTFINYSDLTSLERIDSWPLKP